MLQGALLFYYRAWEDYGSQTGNMAERLKTAVNYANPIDLRQYDVVRVPSTSSTEVNRIDLVPTHNPLERKYELQAVMPEEADDWVKALRGAKGGPAEPGASSSGGSTSGQATVIVTAK